MANTVCGIKTSNKFLKALGEKTPNVTVRDNIFTILYKDGQFDSELVNYLKQVLGEDVNIDITDTKFTIAQARKLVPEVLKFYYGKYPDADFTSREFADDKSSFYGYSSDIERTNGVRHVGDVLLKIYNELVDKGIELKGNRLDSYIKLLKDRWLDHILTEAETVSNRTKEDLKGGYEEANDKAAYLDKILGGVNKSRQAANKLAVWKELFCSDIQTSGLIDPESYYSSTYIDEVLSSNKSLQSIKRNLYKELDVIIDASKAEEQRSETEGQGEEGENKTMKETEEPDIVDVIGAYNNHSGQTSSYLKAFSERIRNYFNSLDVSAQPIPGAKDTSNSYGIPDCMNFEQCVKAIRQKVTFDNPVKMIREIRNLSKTVKGFEAFAQLAYDLANDSDFCNAFMHDFRQALFSKDEVILEDGKSKIRQANKKTDATIIIRDQFFDDIQSTILDYDSYTFALEKGICYNSLNPIIDRYHRYLVSTNQIPKSRSELRRVIKNPLDETNSKGEKLFKTEEEFKRYINEQLYIAIANVARFMKSYFPSITEDMVYAYVINSPVERNDAVVDNITNAFNQLNTLMSWMTLVGNDATNCKTNYEDILSEIHHAEIQNQQRDRLQELGEDIPVSEYDDIDTIKDRSFLTGTINDTVIKLANAFSQFTVSDTDNNTRNIYGNNQSDWINNSHFSFIKRLSEGFVTINGQLRNPLLEQWGIRKLKKNQYKYSTFLLEQTDEHGNRINFGLFRKVGDNFVLTEYAQTLLRVGIFQGSSDLDNNTNAGYSKMTKGDYLPTLYLAFHADGYRQEDTRFEGLELGTFFPRTPADAPKQYDIRMPKYSTEGLFDYADSDGAGGTIYRATMRYANVATAEELNVDGLRPMGMLDSIGMENYIFPTGDLLVGAKGQVSAKIVDHESNTARVAFSNNNGDVFVLEGVMKLVDDSLWLLTEPKYIGMVNKNIVNGRQFNTLLPKTNNFPDGLLSHNVIFNIIDKKMTDLLEQGDQVINGEEFKQIHKIINREHPVYKMMLNTFKQELLDAATALNHYFKFIKTPNGTYEIDIDENGVPVLKDDPKIKNADGTLRGYNFYHLKDGKLFEAKKLKDGHKQYGVNLLGNVFHSDRFNLFATDDEGNYPTDKKGNIIARKFLEECISSEMADTDKGMINLLYGNETGTNLHIVFESDPQDTNESSNLKVADVVLTPEQEKKVGDKIEAFLKEYLKQAVEEINNFEQFITEDNLKTYDKMEEFAINYLLFYNASSDIFEGDSKFYKDTRTIFKRAKQDQAAGKSYSSADFTELAGTIRGSLVDSEYGNTGLHPINNSFITNGIMQRPKMTQKLKPDGTPYMKNGKPVMEQVEVDGKLQYEDVGVQTLFKKWGLDISPRNGFRAVTIANSKNSRNITFDRLVDDLTRIYKKELKIPEEAARAKAATLIYGPIQFNSDGTIKKDKNGEPVRRGGFTDTKVNDAQSYITFEEFIRRLDAKGMLKKYMPLIEKIMDESQPLTAKDLNAFVQVQKNYYYDFIEDEDYGLFPPRQIKNAEFVLIPRFIRGTQLYQVYEMMKRGNIDQLNTVETSKAANETVLKLWDNNGDIDYLGDDGMISDEKIQKFADEFNANGQNYYYTSLYSQQETPQHMDAENKAGIQILKKLIDNIPPNHPRLADIKAKYFKLLCSNIDESLSDLLDELDIPSKNGKIDLNSDGTIKGLNKKALYDKFKDEAMRNGMDTNMLKYVTLDIDTNEPYMPSYMNNILTKFESIAQSVLNHSITRQTLKGFHAAQVTNVGFKSIRDIFDDPDFDAENVTYDKKLRYHPEIEVEKDGKKIKKTAGYIEIMVPLSFLGLDRNSSHYKNMSKEEILAELESKELLDIIGYRIPTEGKQSVCNMKVVGLLDDAQGSTIIVPDEWVAQTGSDFDIDSIYAIQYNTYKKGNGELLKVQYKEKFDEFDYINYLRRFEDKIVDDSIKNNKTSARTKLKAKTDEEKDKLKARNKEAWANLLKVLAETHALDTKKVTGDKIFKKLRKRVSNESRETGGTPFEIQLDFSQRLITELTERLYKVKPNVPGADEVKEAIKSVIEAYSNTIDYYNNGTKEVYNEKYREELRQEILNSIEDYNKIAKEAGLLTYEEFISSENTEKLNSKVARDNELLRLMQYILEDESALEENLSRSNFDDIVAIRNAVMNMLEAARRNNTSANNVFDQIQYQEDAMSGADLKALSVTLDTFCSVCNTVRPTLTKKIKVVYEETETTNNDTISRNYGRKAKKHKYGLEFEHKEYGWSETNRNMADKILTAYSSQTTALILDAVKEGNIPNVNTYSFGAFKTLVNCGVSYEAAIPFIMQPGITRVINDYNRLNSVFGASYGNPVVNAIKQIASELDIATTDDEGYSLPVEKIIGRLNEKYRDKIGAIFEREATFNEETGKEEYKNLSFNSNFPIITKLINDRIQEEGMFSNDKADGKLNQLLFDLGNILIFNNLQIIAKDISDIARCCNPDKFGAKQSIYETKQVLENIDDCLYKKDTITPGYKQKEGSVITRDRQFAKSARKPILVAKDYKKSEVHILEAIYPGCNVIDGIAEDIINNMNQVPDTQLSKYPTLYAFLRNATCTSLILSKHLFDTEKPRFVSICNGLRSVLSGNNPRLTEQQYRDFQKYLLASLYSDTVVVKNNIKVRVNNGQPELSFGELNREEERRRIYGYGYPPGLFVTTYERDENGNVISSKNVEFKPADINNPTDEEMEIFDKFSPAQKVAWIRANFSEPRLFSYIKPTLVNLSAAGTKANTQSLAFEEDSTDINHIYSLFRRAYRNNNPILMSAAIDIIKYAAQVEGFRMTKTAVMKVIDNDILLQSELKDGIRFVPDVQTRINDLNNGVSKRYLEFIEDLYENYLRSHPKVQGIKTTRLTNRSKQKYHLTHRSYGGFIMLNSSDTNHVDNLVKLGIIYEHSITGDYGINKYIRLVDTDGTNTLYKIEPFLFNSKGVPTHVVLYPLTNLRTNEDSLWSIDAKNNRKILDRDLYRSIIAELKENFVANFDKEWVKERIKRFEETGERTAWYKDAKALTDSIPTDPFNLDELAEKVGGQWLLIKNRIKAHFRPGVTQTLFIRNKAFSSYIHTTGDLFASPQTIVLPDGTALKVRIGKYATSGETSRDWWNSINYKYFATQDGEGNFKARENPNSEENSSLREIIKSAQNSNQQFIDQLYYVDLDFSEDSTTENDNDDTANARTILDCHSDTIGYANRVSRNKGDLASFKYLQVMHNNNVTRSISTIDKNKTLVDQETAKFAHAAAMQLKHNFDVFRPDPDDSVRAVRMQDDKAMIHVFSDTAAEREYLDNILEAESFVRHFGIYESVKLENPTEAEKFALESIKADIAMIKALPIEHCKDMYKHRKAEDISSNPLIRENFIDIMDGFWKTYGDMWRFNDIAENGTPFLQIMMKDVLGNIDAQRIATLRYIKDFRNRMTKFKEEAERKGLRFDISKMVDKHGRWVQDYNSSFTDKIEELKANIDAAIQDTDGGLGSIKHMRAKLEFDKFKALHCNQPASPEYYIQKCVMLERFLNTNPRLAEAYYKLYYERVQLYDYITEEGIDEDKLQEIQKITKKIYSLRSSETYIDPNTNEYTQRTSAENLRVENKLDEYDVLTETEYDFSNCSDEDAIYSIEAGRILDQFITANQDLDRTYFLYDEKFGFKETLERNLQVVSSFEKRGADGELITPLSVLMENETYVNAKKWIATNAKYILVKVEALDIRNMSLAEIKDAATRLPQLYSSLIAKAKAILGLQGYATPSAVLGYIRSIAADRVITDKYGNIDARLLTPEELKKIQIMLNNFYHNDLIPIESDRILLSNAQPTNEVFTKYFYNKLSGTSTINVERIKIIDELNKKLRPLYNEATKTIDFHKIPDTPEGLALIKEIGDLYQKLRLNRNKNQRTKETQKWIDENVDFVVNKTLINRLINGGIGKSVEWQQAISENIVYEKDDDGDLAVDENGEPIFNKFLFSYAKPKDKVKEMYTDTDKVKALEIIKNAFVTTILPAYYEAKHEAEQNGTYEEWFENNHVYNPYSKRYEPLSCWTRREYNVDYLNQYFAENYPDFAEDETNTEDVIGKWIPNISQTDRTVQEDKANPNYDPNVGLAENYVPGSGNGAYDSHTDLNEVEKAARDYMYQTLLESAQNRQGKGYFKHGNLPKELKREELSAQLGIKEALKLFGIGVSTESGTKPWYKEMNYDNDRVPIMPMTSELNNKQTRTLEEKIEKLRKNAPTPEQCATEQEYNERVAKNEEDIAKLQDELKELRESLMDRDWLKVIENYLIQAGRFNAVQENKQKLYFLQEELKRMKMYTRTHGMNGDLQVISDTDGETVYDMATDDNVIKQLEVVMRRILLDQWKEPEGNYTKFANALQSFTSANYMTFNIRGGIANVTLGLTGILGERVASEYFQHWRSATNEWRRGLISYARRAYNQTIHNSNISYTKQDAIIKYFNVVDYDEHTGLIKERDLKSISEGIRNFTYSPQTLGEHFMQNSVLFAMLKSHKLVETENGITYMNRAEYLRYKEGDILNSILDDEQKEEFKKFKEQEKANKNKAKDYAWFRKNLLVEWAYIHSGVKQIKEFITKREEAEDDLIKEFDELPDMYSQLKLGEDGDMGFVEGSQLEALHNQFYRNGKVTEAEQLLGNFAERVRKVNNKIHGVYNRDGAAYIEKQWWGSLVMQYHKHLPIGLLKRYRARGLFNEFRGSVEKGLWQSMADFVSLNWRKIKASDPSITDDQLGAIQGLQYFFAHSLHFFGQFATTWHILPEYERANILRNFGDFAGTLGAFFTLIALWYIADTDDEFLDNPGWNLAVYEMDRLASECFMYNPWGLMSETKKLMSTPVAAQSVVGDAFSSVIAGFKWLTGDEDYDMTYQSGRFAGQNKLWVYIKRRIPMYSSLYSLFDIVNSNQYYKVGDTGSTIFGSARGYAGDLRGHEVGKKETRKKKKNKKKTNDKEED